MKLDLSLEFDRNKAQVYFNKLMKDGVKIELKKIVKQRTMDQMKYLHVCLAMFANDTGYSIDETKEVFSHQLPEILRYEKNGHNFRKSTNDLDTKECGKLIDLVRQVANEELGLYIPDATEYLINRFAIEKELDYLL